MKKLILSLAVLLFSAPTEYASTQMVTLRYGQIPSKIKTVLARHFYIAQHKALCAPRRDGDADPQLNRETGDQKLRRPQGQNRRPLPRRRYHSVIYPPAHGDERRQGSQFQNQRVGRHPVRPDCLKESECDAVPLGQPEDLVLMNVSAVRG
jgi:hypothetical protein